MYESKFEHTSINSVKTELDPHDPRIPKTRRASTKAVEDLENSLSIGDLFTAAMILIVSVFLLIAIGGCSSPAAIPEGTDATGVAGSDAGRRQVETNVAGAYMGDPVNQNLHFNAERTTANSGGGSTFNLGATDRPGVTIMYVPTYIGSQEPGVSDVIATELSKAIDSLARAYVAKNPESAPTSQPVIDNATGISEVINAR